MTKPEPEPLVRPEDRLREPEPMTDAITSECLPSEREVR